MQGGSKLKKKSNMPAIVTDSPRTKQPINSTTPRDIVPPACSPLPANPTPSAFPFTPLHTNLKRSGNELDGTIDQSDQVNISKSFTRHKHSPSHTNIPTVNPLSEVQVPPPPLQYPLSSMTLAQYQGPTPESNWVIPGVLLVGAYPATNDDSETMELIVSILQCGVSMFVCLQKEYRDDSLVTESLWRSGGVLRPYFRDVSILINNKHRVPGLRDGDLVHRAANRGGKPTLSNGNGKKTIVSEHVSIVDSKNASFVHFPIEDCGVTDDPAVLNLARYLVQCCTRRMVNQTEQAVVDANAGDKVASGKSHKCDVIYLHCWGGHGRTGTLVCIMLHLMYGLNANEAMARCQRAHDLRQCPVAVGSPQTQLQRDQVTRIISSCMTYSSQTSTTNTTASTGTAYSKEDDTQMAAIALKPNVNSAVKAASGNVHMKCPTVQVIPSLSESMSISAPPGFTPSKKVEEHRNGGDAGQLPKSMKNGNHGAVGSVTNVTPSKGTLATVSVVTAPVGGSGPGKKALVGVVPSHTHTPTAPASIQPSHHLASGMTAIASGSKKLSAGLRGSRVLVPTPTATPAKANAITPKSITPDSSKESTSRAAVAITSST